MSMLYQEKKYHVDSFANIEKLLANIGAPKVKESLTFHYYTEQPGNDVIKLVKYTDHDEVHMLKESGGMFTLVKKVKVPDTGAGLDWLEKRGFKVSVPIKMANTVYTYKNGNVDLCLLNDSLYSVILDFPAAEYATIEKELGLEHAEVITLPYNKYLERQ